MYIQTQASAAAAVTLAAGAALNVFNVIAGEPGAGTQDNLNAPGSNRLNGQPFVVRASGFLTLPAGTVTTAATPVQFVLYGSNTSAFAAASGNALYSSTAIAIFTFASAAAKTVPWEIEFLAVGDNSSAKVIGKGQFMNIDPNGVQLGSAAATSIAQSPTTLNFGSEPPIQFAVGVSTAAVNNLPVGSTATLTSFQLEV